MKPIRFTKHARQRLVERKTTQEEVCEAVENGVWLPAERGKQRAKATFPFFKEHNGKLYKYKTVDVIFVEEITEIVIITVYAYFGQEEGK